MGVRSKWPCYDAGHDGRARYRRHRTRRIHVLATEKAKRGERFILSDRTVTLLELAEIIVDTLGKGKVPRVMPLGLAKIVATLGEGIASLSKRPPLIPKGQLHFMQWGAEPLSTRAQEKLGLSFMPLDVGIANTLEYLSS